MKQALEIDDLRELAELLTAAEAAVYLRISEWMLATGCLPRRSDASRSAAPSVSRLISSGSYRIMFMERR
jgi:hypothetical protein